MAFSFVSNFIHKGLDGSGSTSSENFSLHFNLYQGERKCYFLLLGVFFSHSFMLKRFPFLNVYSLTFKT